MVDIPLTKKEQADILLTIYQSQIARSEHYENQRAKAANLIVIVSGGLMAFATFDNQIKGNDFWLGILLIAFGLFGFAISRAHGIRAYRHGKRAAAYRMALDKKVPEVGLNAIRAEVPRKKSYLTWLWNSFLLAIVIFGIFLTALAWPH